MLRFLVTGAGRSGTQLITALLNSCGIPTAHEKVFDHDLRLGDDLQDRYARGKEFHGEASWFAAPWTIYLPKEIYVLHQLRNPLRVIECYYTHGLLQQGNLKNYVEQFFPLQRYQGLSQVIQWWCYWNFLASRRQYCGKYLRYKIEDFPDKFVEILDTLKITPTQDPKEIYHSLGKVGGCGPGTHKQITPAMIDELPEAEQFWKTALTYGYTREEMADG